MSMYFDESHYLQAKLAQLDGTTDAEGMPYTLETLKEAISNAGMTPYEHYVRYGEAEGVAPNELFNPVQYARAVAESWNENAYKGFSGWAESDVLALVQGYGITLYDHFSQVGWLQNLNASNAFDVAAYLQDKAAAVGLSVADTVSAFVAAGVDAVTHFLAWGKDENIPVTTVPLEDAVRTASSFNALPDDPLFSQQWHLQNTGQSGYTPGIDLNVVPVWGAYTGKGVSVSVMDTGVEFDHPDLAHNIDPSRSFGCDGTDGQPLDDNWLGANGKLQDGDNHGMACAGLIAAEADNRTGGTGIAFDAKLSSTMVSFVREVPYETIIDTFNTTLTKGFDVVSCSWAIRASSHAEIPDTVAEYNEKFWQVAQHIDAGRDGKGQIVCFAAGNYNAAGSDSSSLDLIQLPETIAVGAVGPFGQAALYSSEFAGVLVSAPSQSYTFDAQGNVIPKGSIVTTDRQGEQGYNTKPSPEGDDGYTFGGTSAACPQVAGVVALMLEANPNLGWRDVQSILALTARNTDPTDHRWVENAADNWNGGGLSHHRQMGFGLVDATAAVRLAETWTEQNTSANQAVVSATVNVEGAVPNGTGHALTSTLTINDQMNVENVVVHVRLDHGYSSDLELRLTSPSGTRLTIFDDVLTLNSLPPTDENGNIDFTGYNLSALTSIKATGFRGDESQGVWTLEVWDTQFNQRVGTLHDWTMELYGKSESADDTYFYTNDFARLSADPARTVLTDAEGYNTLNTAAVSTDVYVDMRAGQNGLWITGKQVALAEGTAIQRVFTGDGNDTVVTNSLGNNIHTGRGNDIVVVSGPGSNVIDGGAGLNSVQFFGNRGNYNVQFIEGHYVVSNQEGVNELYNVQNILFADQTIHMDFMTQFA